MKIKFPRMRFNAIFVFFFIFLLIFGVFYTAAYLFLIDSNIKQIVKGEMDKAESLVNVVYLSESTEILTSLRTISGMKSLHEAIESQNPEDISEIISGTFSAGNPDFIFVVSNDNQIIASNLNNTGDSFFMPELAEEVALSKSPLISTENIPLDWILSYDEGLYWDSAVKEIDKEEGYYEYALVNIVLVPVFSENKNISAILVGGKILNRDGRIPNALRSYGIESAIYSGDVNIASSSFTKNNNMYTGFRIDEDTYRSISEKGRVLDEREFFIEKSYVTFMPIRDYQGKMIGAIEFGFAKSKYNYMSDFLGAHDIIPIALSLLLIGVLLAYASAYYITKRFMKPLLKTFAEIVEGVSRKDESISKDIRK